MKHFQPITEARQKDIYEKHLWHEVCKGHLSLREAQKRISGDWMSFMKKAKLGDRLGGEVVDEDDL